MLGVVGLKVWPGVNLIKLLHLYVFQLSHLWIHGFNKGNFDAGINSCSTGQTTSVDYTCKFCTQRTCSDKHVAVAHGHKFFDVFPWLNKFFFKHVIWRTKVASCSARVVVVLKCSRIWWQLVVDSTCGQSCINCVWQGCYMKAAQHLIHCLVDCI